VCACACVCIYTYIYIYTCICICIFLYTYPDVTDGRPVSERMGRRRRRRAGVAGESARATGAVWTGGAGVRACLVRLLVRSVVWQIACLFVFAVGAFCFARRIAQVSLFDLCSRLSALRLVHNASPSEKVRPGSRRPDRMRAPSERCHHPCRFGAMSSVPLRSDVMRAPSERCHACRRSPVPCRPRRRGSAPLLQATASAASAASGRVLPPPPPPHLPSTQQPATSAPLKTCAWA
jgi:hypothetical protein